MGSLHYLTTLLLIALTFSLKTRHLAEEYEQGGDDWEGTCAEGHEQSPIDIYPMSEGCDSEMDVDLQIKPGTQTVTLVDKGHTIQADGEFSILYSRNVDEVLTGYKALQFHFHAPSEHHIQGKSYGLEMHIVHSISSEYSSQLPGPLNGRNLAVIGVMFEEDVNAEPNPFIESLRFDEVGVARTIDLRTLLGSEIPSPLDYFTYKGSLTTEPCSELVNWYVLEKPLKIRSDQLVEFTIRYADNSTFAGGRGDNRNIQPLNNRLVRRGGSVCKEQLNYMYVFLGIYFFFNMAIILMMRLTWSYDVKRLFSASHKAKYELEAQKSGAKFQPVKAGER